MDQWVKNLIGIGILLIILAFAWTVLNATETEIEIWEFKAKSKNTLPNTNPTTTSSQKNSNISTAQIKLATKKQSWTADSGWRKGGSSPAEFCGSQKLERELKYPYRTVTLLNSAEKHKTERTPFKHDYYKYSCVFEDTWTE